MKFLVVENNTVCEMADNPIAANVITATTFALGENLIAMLEENGCHVAVTEQLAVAGSLSIEPEFAVIDSSIGPIMMITVSVINQLHALLSSGQWSPEKRDIIYGELIVHELQHIKQIHAGRMQQNNVTGAVTWDGVEWTAEQAAAIRYLDLPWERDACEVAAQWAVTKGYHTSFAEAWATLEHNFATRGGLVTYREAA